MADGPAQRFDVTSADGTTICAWVRGAGPPLVLVHGSLSDHRRFDPLVAELEGDVTTYALDRRGFGASGDAPGYSIEREFDGVAAVVDAVAAREGRPVTLFGALLRRERWPGERCARGANVRW